MGFKVGFSQSTDLCPTCPHEKQASGNHLHAETSCMPRHTLYSTLASSLPFVAFFSRGLTWSSNTNIGILLWTGTLPKTTHNKGGVRGSLAKKLRQWSLLLLLLLTLHFSALNYSHLMHNDGQSSELKHLNIMSDLGIQPILELLYIHPFIILVSFTSKAKQAAKL